MEMATAVVDICTGIVDDYDLTERITTYPNPSNGEFFLDIEMPGTADVNATVIDLAGRTVWTKTYQDVSGKFLETISLPNSSKGVYGLSLEIDNRTYFKRLTVY
mgnify:CR=1 FL=1